MNGDAYRAFLDLLKRLDQARIAFDLHQSREEALMIRVTVPGERWEIELVDYGDEFHWEVERFRSNGKMEDESAIDELFAVHGEPAEEAVSSHDTTRS